MGMPKKPSPKGKKSPATPHAGSSSEYTHKVETVVIRYRKGVPLQIVHPQHLTCLQHVPPQPVDKGGRPCLDRIVRYVLNRALFDYVFIPRDTPREALTRHGLATLAVKWCKQERDRIHALKDSLPKRKKELEKLADDFFVSGDTFENFLKPFFQKPRQRLSPNALQQIFPHLWY